MKQATAWLIEEAQSVSGAPAASAPAHAPVTTASSTVLDCLDALLSSSASSSQPTRAAVHDEVERYLVVENISRSRMRGTESGDGVQEKYGELDWWRDNQGRFPAVATVAKRYLAAPPTSVASERLFSAAGRVYTDRRTNLMPQNADKLLFLKYNMPAVRYNYV